MRATEAEVRRMAAKYGLELWDACSGYALIDGKRAVRSGATLKELSDFLGDGTRIICADNDAG